MRFLFLFCAVGVFAQTSFAQVRTFSSSELKGVHKAFLEVGQNGVERLIGFWEYRHTPDISGGIVVMNIINDELVKVWEDNSTLAFVQDWDSADINGDGRFDFAVAGSGTIEQHHRYFIALYMSEGENQYRKHLFPQSDFLHHVTLGDIDGDKQVEVLFTEQFESHTDTEHCVWPEIRLKIGKWIGEGFLVEETEITLGVGDDWDQWLLGDVDNDGKDEAILHQHDVTNEFGNSDPGLGRSILIYDLDEGTTPTHIIQRPDVTDSIPILSINKNGQLLEFKKGEIRPTVLNLDGSLSKIALPDIPEIDLAQWNPIQVSNGLILSEGLNGDPTERQLTIYK